MASRYLTYYTPHDLTGSVVRDEEITTYSESQYNPRVWKGKYNPESTGSPQTVAVKVMIPIMDCGQAEIQRLINEVELHPNMYRHVNLAPFIGICYEDMPGWSLVPCLITPFYENGSIVEYIENAEIDGAVRINWLFQVLNGLAFLHVQNIVHGNLKPTNILIDDQDNAVLVEFGLTPMPWMRERYSNMDGWDSVDCYLAPELLSTPTPTFSSDVWAAGMVGLQILSGKIPYVEYENIAGVINALLIPKKVDYPGVPEDAWSAFLLCWRMHPTTRPAVETLREQLAPTWLGAQLLDDVEYVFV